MRKQIVVVASLLLALSLGACGGSGDKASGDSAQGEQTAEEAPQEQAQAFDSELATVEYRETIDSTGNAVVLFSLTNKTDRTLMATGENILVNGQYQVQSLGGSDISGIAPGATGQVSIVFGVSTQTPLAGVSDLETISADFVLRDSDNMTETVGTVHVDVTV